MVASQAATFASPLLFYWMHEALLSCIARGFYRFSAVQRSVWEKLLEKTCIEFHKNAASWWHVDQALRNTRPTEPTGAKQKNRNRSEVLTADRPQFIQKGLSLFSIYLYIPSGHPYLTYTEYTPWCSSTVIQWNLVMKCRHQQHAFLHAAMYLWNGFYPNTCHLYV